MFIKLLLVLSIRLMGRSNKKGKDASKVEIKRTGKKKKVKTIKIMSRSLARKCNGCGKTIHSHHRRHATLCNSFSTWTFMRDGVVVPIESLPTRTAKGRERIIG